MPLVLAVDDESSILRIIAMQLESEGFEVQTASTGEEAIEALTTIDPDIVVLDVVMPGMTGLDVQRALAKQGLKCPVIFVTGHGDVRTSVQAMRGGAVDFLTKPFELCELLDALERAISRSRHFREIDDRLASVRHRVESLTPREREVFKQVIDGLLNKQIAANLGISEKTVKVHRGRVMRKMSVRSVAQLVRAADQVERLQDGHEQ